jgi:hypothetical protein
MPSLCVSVRPDHQSVRQQITCAIEHLKSLHDGECGFTEVVGLGPDAIPSLRSLLFEREPSGLPHARLRAAEALAALKAFEVLADFLRLGRQITDPVERLGEETVMSAAGRLVARLRKDWVYDLLADLAGQRPLRGVLMGLGSFFRKESIPIFISALIEDEVRLTAEAILRGFGKVARKALLAAALDQGGNPRSESESNLRKRRSALALLLETGLPRGYWPRVRSLIDDRDHQIALLACTACLNCGTATDMTRIPARLAELQLTAGWFDRGHIADLLRRCSTCAKSSHDSVPRPRQGSSPDNA